MSKERISWENEYPDELEREGRMRPTLARAVRDHEAAGNVVDEAVAEAVWADGEGEAAAMDVVDDAPAMGAVDEAAVAEAVGEGGRVKSGRPRETQQQKLARIKRELEAVPTEPGVYLWKDAAGEVIYVGKAKQLRARMRQYVNFQDDRAKIPLLVEAIDSFDYLVVDNEHVVAWDASLNYNIQVASGMFGFTTGEGVVNSFNGYGRVYIQTRNLQNLAQAMHPYLPTSAS